jgi:UDP-4-amino-4,6-dideoxy-N-acetyl-beta-L-altrosamine N-acetyltransferase
MENDKLEIGDVHIHNILNLNEGYISKLRYWRNQDFVRDNMFSQEIICEDEHIDFIDQLREKKGKYFYLCFIGEKPFGVLYYDYFTKNNNLEFGYYLVEDKYTNSGLGVIMEYALLNHGFYDLKVHKVFCRTLTRNEKVVSLHNNFGFLTEGILKQHIKIYDNYLDLAVQAIDKNTWNVNKPKIEKYIKVLLGTHTVGKIEGWC